MFNFVQVKLIPKKSKHYFQPLKSSDNSLVRSILFRSNLRPGMTKHTKL